MENHQLRIKYTPAQQEILFDNTGAKFKIVPKGRRFGATRGFANGYIEWALEGISPLLWVDTINGNIERYYERYFLPTLKQLPASWWKWDVQKKVLKINDSLIDFRSADAPESIEGFGYKKIFLNEAGIILKNNYLYSNAILPMLMDYPDSQLIAAGVPKGKMKKDGEVHKFWELWEKVLNHTDGYWGKTYSSYDNPLLSPDDIQQIIDEVSQAEASQEIFGQFVEISGNNPFAFHYSKERHESDKVQFDPKKRIIISIDFNVNPFAVIFKHIWRDQWGEHNHTFDEAAIQNGNIPSMIQLIKERYGKWLTSAMLTGDLGGNRRDISQQDNAPWFNQILRGLNMSETQLKISYNPRHEESRQDVNFVLLEHPDYKIHPDKCPNLCRDMKAVQANRYGEIIKANRSDTSQRADHLDAERYAVHNFMKEWIETQQRNKRR